MVRWVRPCEGGGMSFDRIRRIADRPYPGRVELAALAVLYGAYELVRGFGSEDWAAARAHTADIVALERRLNLFVEQDIQQLAGLLPGVPALLGLLYVALHFAGTAGVLVWVHSRRPHAFPFLRTTLIVSTGLALAGYVLYPAAPPRLANLGFADTVSTHTGLNLSSDLLGSLYNPIAAVPSLHFGYSLIVGVALAQLASRRSMRVVGAAYPALMLLVIAPTGHRFRLAACAGGFVSAAGWFVAPRLRAPARGRARLAPPQAAGTAPAAPQHAQAAWSAEPFGERSGPA